MLLKHLLEEFRIEKAKKKVLITEFNVPNIIANNQVKNLFEKGLFGKIDGSNFLKLMSGEQKDKDDKDVQEEINFGFLDAYVEEMENEGTQALPKPQVNTNEQENAEYFIKLI